MATITKTLSNSDPTGGDLWLWETMGNADQGSSVEIPGPLSAMVVQAIGTFGGASVAVQGSNDGSNWFDLDDLGGTAVGLTAAGGTGVDIGDVPRYIRPETSGGTGTDVDVYILIRHSPVGPRG